MILPVKPTNNSGTQIVNEELCTVGSQVAVITWVTPQQRTDTSIYIGENQKQLKKLTFALNREFHYVEMYNLKPSTRYWYQVESNGVRGALSSFTTLPKPEGKYLFSFAVMSDAHINYGETSEDINEIYLGKLVDYAEPLLVQCILDSKNRNIDLAVITGDLTETGGSIQYLGLRNQILPYFADTPYLLCPGNHDKFTKNNSPGEQGFLNYLAGREITYTSVIFKDYLFLLIDSCRQDDNWGYIDPVQMQWMENVLEKNKGRPAFLFLHHPCNGPDLWFGLKNHRDFQKVTRRFSNIQGVFCGHMHRSFITINRLTGDRPYVEVPATVQFPCAYAIVRAYENGFEYNVYKVSRLDLSELSRERFILKKGGKALLTRYCMGSTGDRSLSYFNGKSFRPKQYEISVTLDNNRAGKLYEKASNIDGASLIPAYDTQKSKVILGRYDSLHLTLQAYRQKFSRYGVSTEINGEARY